ncbi:HCP-like protein, partial [Hortaea werneckii]
ELIQEAKHILQRLSDRAYPFAQYYLADGYSSGFFNPTTQKPDHDKAFPLFVSASKHGHAEAGYRAALSYEFAWGTSKNYAKAVQFLRASASKGHPGAAVRLALACLRGDMGLPKTKDSYREGCRWLRRAAENADFTHSAGPYELALLHLLPKGFGDDIFPDSPYALQLLTQSAELGHPQAAMLMGKIYEEGLYSCPRDAALSVHFYTSAATRGQLPEAMMALCAWFLVGADPVLPKDEPEAFAWALAAAETGGSSKAEYAVGYFTEMGIGCRRDPLEANVWYVRAADSGSVQARQRLEIIRQAAGAGIGGENGADVVVDARKGKAEAVKEVHAVTNGHGADATVNLSDAETAAALACAVTKMHGLMVQVAQPTEIKIPFTELIFRDIRVRGSLVSSAEESKSMLKCIADHGVSVKTNPFQGLDKIHELVEMVHGGKIQGKALIVVDQEQIDKEKKIGAKF